MGRQSFFKILIYCLSQLSERVAVNFSSVWVFKNTNIFNDLTKVQVPKGSWARKDSRRPAVTQKANERCERVLMCYFPWFHPREHCSEAMGMNASIIPLRVLTLGQFTPLETI